MLVEVTVTVDVLSGGICVIVVVVLLAIFVLVEVALGRVVVRVLLVTVTVTVAYGCRVWEQVTAFGYCVGMTAAIFAFGAIE